MKNAFKGHRITKKSRKFCVYTVYENATDKLICLDAEASEAAAETMLKAAILAADDIWGVDEETTRKFINVYADIINGYGEEENGRVYKCTF